MGKPVYVPCHSQLQVSTEAQTTPFVVKGMVMYVKLHMHVQSEIVCPSLVSPETHFPGDTRYCLWSTYHTPSGSLKPSHPLPHLTQ